jgi:hypothetical protein
LDFHFKIFKIACRNRDTLRILANTFLMGVFFWFGVKFANNIPSVIGIL